MKKTALHYTMKGYLTETLIIAVLDSGCKNNVCGNIWMICYLNTTKSDDSGMTETKPTLTTFKSRNGEQIKPQIVSSNKTFIETDVVVCATPVKMQ